MSLKNIEEAESIFKKYGFSFDQEGLLAAKNWLSNNLANYLTLEEQNSFTDKYEAIDYAEYSLEEKLASQTL